MAKHNPYNTSKPGFLKNYWLWVAVLIIAAITAFFYTQNTDHKSKTAVTTPITENLDRANLTDEAIQSWSYDAVLAVYSFDYLNYEQQFAEAANYFLPKTWELFHEALKRSTTLATITADKLSVSAKIDKTKIRVLDKKVDPQSGRYTWKVQVPMQLIYQGVNRSEQPTFVTLTIVRVPKQQGIAGVAISKFIVAPAQTQA